MYLVHQVSPWVNSADSEIIHLALCAMQCHHCTKAHFDGKMIKDAIRCAVQPIELSFFYATYCDPVKLWTNYSRAASLVQVLFERK